MKIVILPAARDDLADGFQFYEHQQEGLGNYFLKSLFSDIDSLTPFTTPRKREPCLSKPCWIVAGTWASTGESFIKQYSDSDRRAKRFSFNPRNVFSTTAI